MDSLIDGDLSNINFQKSLEQTPFNKIKDELDDEREVDRLKDEFIH